MDQIKTKQFLSFTFKVIIAHTITYFIFGLLMSNIFNYGELFQQDIIKDFMRPIDSSYILLGPFLQPVRGFLFALGIWPIRSMILDKKLGWLTLWNVIIIFGIISTPAAAPCSIEGLLYTKLPVSFHLIGLPEILLQTLSFSLIVFWWAKESADKTVLKPQSANKRKLTFLVMAIMIACFAYVGYAIGGILIASVAGFEVNLKEASSSINIKNQLMFVVAFLANIISIIILSRIWLKNKIGLNVIFYIFWFVDSAVPLLYQFIFSYMMPVHLAFLMGFFPAIIIVTSLYFNRKKMVELGL